MEEQRMLDEMERQLAIDDPRLASRFNSFAQQRLPGADKSAVSLGHAVQICLDMHPKPAQA